MSQKNIVFLIKPFLFSLCFLPLLVSARIYINVGAPKKITKSNLVVSDFRFKPTSQELSQSPENLSLGQKMTRRIQKNMKFSGYFSIVSPKAYLENLKLSAPVPHPKNALGFRWENWKFIGADFIFFGEYFVDTEDIFVTVYLYNINSKKRLLKKSYKAKVFQSLHVVDMISNDIIKKLSGRKSVFGTRIAAVRSLGKFTKELFVMSWNGENKKRITYHRSIVLSPSWSNKGDKLAYSVFVFNKKINKNRVALFLYDFKSNKIKVLSYQKPSVLSSDFFSGDKEILLSAGRGRGQMDIVKFDIKKSILTPLIQGPRGVINVEARIHPKSGRIVFSSDRTGKTMIYTASSRGGGIKQMTFAANHNSNPDWNPYKDELVFSGWSDGRMDLFLISGQGGGIKRLTSLKKSNGAWADSESPSFSPDGRFVVFRSNISGAYQLYILNLENFSIERITFDRYNYNSPIWSPY